MKISDVVKRLVVLTNNLSTGLTQLATDVEKDETPPVVVPPVVIPPVVVPPVVVPPVVVPPVVPPVVTPVEGKKGLYVDGGKLRTKNGAEFVVRGIESMCGSDAFNSGPVSWCATQKAMNANTIAPLWQNSQASPERLKVWLDTARAAGLVVGSNFDHIPDGRAFACRKEIVDLHNKYDNIFLELEVETGGTQTGQQWVDFTSKMVADLRAAGHVHPIKVGSPAFGRDVKFPLQYGQQVLMADPLKNVMFTFQAYWEQVVAGWSYQDENGISFSPADPGGAIDVCKKIRESGLCFLIGIDKIDDVGVTIYKEVMTEADKYGLNVQYWTLGNDFRTDNNLLSDWRLTLAQITATGTEVTNLFAVKSKPASL